MPSPWVRFGIDGKRRPIGPYSQLFAPETAVMRGRLDQRLKQLKAEFEAGQRALADLEAKQTSVRETMLRISGAIQVLEELLAGAAPEGADGAGSAEERPQVHGPSVGSGAVSGGAGRSASVQQPRGNGPEAT